MFIAEKLIAIGAPHACLICRVEGSLLCGLCRPEAFSPVPSRCYRCQAATELYRVCAACRRRSRLLHVWVCTDYGGLSKRLTAVFKFRRAQAAAEPLGWCLAQKLPSLPKDTIVTHVPTASSRVRLRGYDHAALLAREVARHTGLRTVPVLRRVGQTRQVGSTRNQRLKQLEDAFYVRRSEEVQGKKILLVDDLVTTGATLEAAARCLRLAGARTVSAVVFAQKQ